MGKSAVVLGATGQIGVAVVERLVRDGWEVRAVSRGGGPRVVWPVGSGVRTVHLDRNDDRALVRVVGEGCDVLVDCVAFGSRHGAQLAALGDRVGSAAVISTCMVYRDDDGVGFDALPGACPRFTGPVTEEQATVAPDDTTYAGGKVALERVLLESAPFPVTLLRAGMVHGAGSAAPREWYFVKRALDRRPVRLLAHRGAGICHPSAARNLAELVLAAAVRPGDRVLNVGDPAPPTVRAMAAAVDEVLGHEAEEYLIDGPGEPGLGQTPWSLRRSFVMDMGLAGRELGYRPVCDYAGSLPETVAWLVETARGRDWREAFPRLAARWGPTAFDYAAEDRAIAAGQVGGRPLVPAGRE
ncbi:NAD-dependent epimerase/dehydratase family protein [Streptomyces sp. NBC_00057]|uniref:NAD-dependent epimerase/dehydratase family protein n=1 Tax=Streptomyces sp. NBC_00057 TaxID=2975634 RepID=UPI003247D43B